MVSGQRQKASDVGRYDQGSSNLRVRRVRGSAELRLGACGSLNLARARRRLQHSRRSAATMPVVIDLHRSWSRLNTSPPVTGQAARTARPADGSYVWIDDTAVAVASAAAESVSAQLLRGA